MKTKEHIVGAQKLYVKEDIPDSEEGSGGPLLFVHMSWGGSWAFDFYMGYLAGRGYKCYALDLRGHGKSGGTVEGATMEDYVSDVAVVANGLCQEKPVVVGHSMGGLVALMYGARHPVKGVISMDGSPPIEVQKTSEEKHYKPAYTPKGSGMPSPMKAMFVLSDIYPWRLMKLKMKLGVESGMARSERKKGISVPKEAIHSPMLFIGAEKGASLPFGIGTEKVKAQAEYYEASFAEVKGASHPGILIGKHRQKGAEAILGWLRRNNL